MFASTSQGGPHRTLTLYLAAADVPRCVISQILEDLMGRAEQSGSQNRKRPRGGALLDMC
ncbi:Hypothetical protein, partial CDS, partial [Neorhizobium galegae bv. officinalis]